MKTTRDTPHICRAHLQCLGAMQFILSTLPVWVTLIIVQAQVSSKVDFADDSNTASATNSSQSADDDVEVKHTIVVSTKLKNNNRRGVRIADGDSGTFIMNERVSPKKEDSGEVPVVKGYQAFDTTMIRSQASTPYHKPEIYPDSYFINRNIGDNYDIYPNLATSSQWRPSTPFNNVNWWNQDSDRIVSYNIERPRQIHRTPVKFHRKITDDGMKEFYCCKCRELNRGPACNQPSRNFWNPETTTKVKVDGKIAKLN